MSIPEIHIYLPAHFDFGPSSSAQIQNEPALASDVEQEVEEPLPSAFKTEYDFSGWNF